MSVILSLRTQLRLPQHVNIYGFYLTAKRMRGKTQPVGNTDRMLSHESGTSISLSRLLYPRSDGIESRKCGRLRQAEILMVGEDATQVTSADDLLHSVKAPTVVCCQHNLGSGLF